MNNAPAKRPSRWSLGQKSLLMTLLPLFVAATALIVMTKALALSRDAEDEVQRGLRVLGQIHAVHATLAEAASGVRGFIITQDATFLRPYLRAEEQLRQSLQQLEADLVDPVQRQTLADIAELVDIKLSNLEILQARAQDLPPGSMLDYSRDNKVLLDRLRDRIAFMEQREKQIVTRLQQQLLTTRQTSQWLMVSALLAAFISATVFSQRFARDLIRRVRHIRENAQRIARGEPLLPPDRGHSDELAELDRLVVQTGATLDEKLEELRQATSAAESANLAKTDFLSRTSHELRTPLNAIIGFSELLVDQSLPAKHQQRINTIRRSAHHLLQLVNDLLDLSRLETGKLVLDLQPVNIHDAATTAAEIVAGRAEARNIHLQVLTQAAPLPVTADPHRLLQILINLLDNAIKFSPPGSQVSLQATPALRDQRPGLNILVQDQGAGIAAPQQQHLFSPFQRLGSQQTEGIGLGLAISHSLATQMEGTLRYQSGTDHTGSHFTLWLPCDTGSTGAATSGLQPRQSSPSPLPAPASASHRLHWLVVTDELPLQVQADTLATRFGSTCQALTTEQDWQAVTPAAPCLLITDSRPGTLTLPGHWRIEHTLYVTPQAPGGKMPERASWLPPPLTTTRLRRHLQEFVNV